MSFFTMHLAFSAAAAAFPDGWPPSPAAVNLEHLPRTCQD